MLSIGYLAIYAGAYRAIPHFMLIVATLYLDRYLFNNTRRFLTLPIRSLTSYIKACAISLKNLFATLGDIMLYNTDRDLDRYD